MSRTKIKPLTHNLTPTSDGRYMTACGELLTTKPKPGGRLCKRCYGVAR